MLYKMFRWIKNRFVGGKKVKSGFNFDNPFLIL
jgi:hypothetical protein